MLKYKARSLKFPVGGVNRRRGFESQPPYTTPVALNVFADSQENGRERGGSRPGLVKAFTTQLPGSPNLAAYSNFNSSAGVRSQCILFGAAGELWRWQTGDPDGVLTQVSTSLTIANSPLIQATVYYGTIYIADFSSAPLLGVDGVTSGTSFTSATYADFEAEGISSEDYVLVVRSTGTSVEGTYTIASVSGGTITLDAAPGDATGVHFYVERSPKVYDPVADTLSLWRAETTPSGQYVPVGNPLIATWRERIFLGGGHDNPQAAYASRSGSPDNWDYGAADDLAAFPFTDNFQIQEPITALIPHHNDCFVYGCEDSLWALRGDPTHGGNLTNLSFMIGVLGPYARAWSKTAEKATYWLSKDGVYMMRDPCGENPISVSREKLPDELLHLDPAQRRVLLEYDRRFRFEHIYVSEL